MGVFQLKEVTKRYGREEVLKNFSLEGEAGEIVVLLGPNGSGKSTTLKMLAGLVKANRGEIQVLGSSPGKAHTRRHLSYLPQQVHFPPSARAREILNLVRKVRGERKERVEEIIEFFGLAEWIQKPVGELSGGMLQRLALAAVFLPQVPLYLLDEPGNNLDFEGLQAFRKLAGRLLEEGKTLLLSTHVLADAEILGTKVCLLWEGRLIWQGSATEFFQQVNLKRRLWIRVAHPHEDWEEFLRKEAEEVEKHYDLYRVRILPEKRFHLLDRLARAGAEIKEFGLEEPNLEEVYHLLS